MARPKEKSSEEKIKTCVLAAAEAMVVMGGLSQLNMRTLAVNSRHSVGNIYRLFKSLPNLIFHMKAKTVDELDESMRQIHESSPENCLEELAKAYVSFACRNTNRWRLVFEHSFPKDIETPEWYKKKVESVFSKFEVQFAILAPELSPTQLKQIALAFWGGVHGICVFNLTTKFSGLSDNDFEESIHLHIRRFIYCSPMHSMVKKISS